MKKIIAIIGDYYHKEALILPSFDKAVQKINDDGEVMEVSYISVDQLVERLQDQPDAVVLYKANILNPTEKHVRFWMNKELEQAICSYVKNGGGWFGWHSGLSGYENFDDYYSMIRGKFDYHPPEQQVVTYIPSEISMDISLENRVEFVDEHYFVTCDEPNTNVFLQANSKDGNSKAGWSHEYGKGRVICLTPAHSKEALLHPEMIDLLSQTLKWCCRKSTL